MAIKIDYLVRDTVGNFRRNVLMSSAAILTVTISLYLVGGALLLRQGVTNATVQWKGGAELSIFMNSDASASQIDAVRAQLGNMPQVKSARYVDKQEAYKEAQTLFASQPDTLNSLTVEDMPPSFRVVPTKTELIKSIGDQFQNTPGVRNVSYAKDVIQTILTVSRWLQISLIVVATVLLASAALLILNTIRIAIFARRREISVMKLVGATDWFIRVPFMLEGMIQGLIGGGIAFLLIVATRAGLAAAAHDHPGYTMLRRLIVTPSQAIGSAAFVLIVGVVVGVVGSLLAVHRFLKS